uniref:Serine dehydrogenase proteinase n=1 Tax=Candidatus Kentrum sp. FM TaxID=2126340 RepID=A0A450U047_9GAMM|nr:MAG: Serine dehydrogenase proteinase [Candidatus Kentron sp. FM]VFJ75859.1 MAG: Serine dehydrogenase proteinase [Candidatus Kentron sp. FM]VFK22593.1 MAG: Serine dehydrogenase proteinase [Candidatus Kentron sp. FM]
MRKQRIAMIERLQQERDSIVFVYWNLDELKREDFFTLSDILEQENPQRDIELIILSPGGSGEAGYRIGHTFQQWAKRHSIEFRVIVPLYAKSAATLLSLGAQSIVMGLQSEIGPIDPQIPKYDQTRKRWRYIPAMALIDGLKLVSEYINKIPEMSRLFEEIVKNEKLTLDDLGLIERSRESGKQYGEALLLAGMLPDEEKAREIVERLSDYYKFHGHPIDAYEAEELLTLSVTHCQGKEWASIKGLRDEYNSIIKFFLVDKSLIMCYARMKFSR